MMASVTFGDMSTNDGAYRIRQLLFKLREAERRVEALRRQLRLLLSANRTQALPQSAPNGTGITAANESDFLVE